jgi:DNA-directed RNA polymerase specialized sigma24 family protein
MTQRDRPSQRRRSEEAAATRDGVSADDAASARRAWNRLTPEERLVCLGKRLRFSNRELAQALARSVDAIHVLYRSATAKIRRWRK